jgi:hypothetical protein
MKFQSVSALLFLAELASSTPVQGNLNAAQRAQVAQTAHDVDAALLALNDCKAQSCVLADAAGSSGKLPTLMPEGANDEDIKCIVKYNPSVKPLLEKGDIPKVPKQDTGVSTTLFKWLDSLQRPSERKNGETDKGTFNGTCTPNILIFSKGTLEPTQ